MWLQTETDLGILVGQGWVGMEDGGCKLCPTLRMDVMHNLTLHVRYARNTPGSICQYKKDGLVSRPPSLFMSMRRPMHGTSCPKSQLKCTCLTAKFGSFLDHTETSEKGQNVISSSVQHPISLILQSMFLLSYLYQWGGFCSQSICRNLRPQFVYTAVSLDWKLNIYEYWGPM